MSIESNKKGKKELLFYTIVTKRMMRKFLLAMIMLLLTGSAALAQSTMSDEQVISFIMEEKEKGSSQTDIVAKLMQRGIDIQQIQRIKRKYERQIQQSGMGAVADEAINNASKRMRTNNGQQRVTGSGSQMIRQQSTTRNEDDPNFLQMQAELGGIMPVDSIALLEQMLEQQEKQKNRIFGHDIFNNEALSFEPNMNIATPADYRLGPGDAVAVEIYGASQQSIDATITPDANPSISFCIQAEISFFRQNTNPAPTTVPASGIINAVRISFISDTNIP